MGEIKSGVSRGGVWGKGWAVVEAESDDDTAAAYNSFLGPRVRKLSKKKDKQSRIKTKQYQESKRNLTKLKILNNYINEDLGEIWLFPGDMSEEKNPPEAPKTNLNEALLQSAKENDMAGVEKWLQEGADAAYQMVKSEGWDEVVDCPLHHAVNNNNVAMARLLMSKGAKTSGKFGSSGWSRGIQKNVFDEMCSHKNPAFLGLALEFGADPNLETQYGHSSMRTDSSVRKTSLHTMIQHGDIAKARLLLEAKANPNAIYTERIENERGYSGLAQQCALCRAINGPSATREEMVRLLLEHKATPNTLCNETSHVDNPDKSERDDPRAQGYKPEVIRVDTSCPALHRALRQKDSQDCVFSLLLHGADPAVAGTVSQGCWMPKADTATTQTTAQLLEKETSISAEVRALIASPPSLEGIGQVLASCQLPSAISSVIFTYV
eukprot:g5300.t1